MPDTWKDDRLLTSQTSVPLRLAHGIGAAAFGIKNNGFDYFLLLFYGTIVGLEPGLVGLAILIALLFDAISDPLVGYWSDNLRSKWGRRHPFMYASAFPVAFSYFLLWNPPDWSQSGLFWYLTLTAIMIRTFITFYETPSTSLLPELTKDYDERTSVQSYRQFFGWAGGNLMSVLMFGVILAGSGGMQQRDGYETYGIVASILIFVAIMISTLGTHHRIPSLSQPNPAGEKYSLKRVITEMVETWAEKSFLALFLTMIFGSVATGLAASLSFILLNYFWGFSEFQLFIWTATVFFSAFFGFIIAPRASRRFGKKNATIYLGIIAFTMAPAPVILRLFDLMPDNGHPMLFPIVVTINIIDLSLIIAIQAVLASMVADLVESNEAKTGRRNEGVYYASITFTRKATQGLGALAAGLILTFIAFPQGAAPELVEEETLWWLGALYAPSVLLLWAVMLYCVSLYKIDRSTHMSNLQKVFNTKAKF